MVLTFRKPVGLRVVYCYYPELSAKGTPEALLESRDKFTITVGDNLPGDSPVREQNLMYERLGPVLGLIYAVPRD